MGLFIREFLSSKETRFPAVSTQPLVRWVTRDVSPRVKRLGSKADYSYPSTTEVKNA
jgi:hypothetical protein